ncbi:M23 family metallopeptidase [Gemmiger formicilis]|nr:M23 family metallopeptidase [Gemmiger formicilis]
MNEVGWRTETQTCEVEQTDEDGNSETTTITETVLIIELTHRTSEEMRETYHFTDRQNEYLTLLSSEDTAILWGELLGGFVQGSGDIMAPGLTGTGDGALQWPLPVAGSITSQFGYRTDPISGETSYHSGTDIAAPEGTPILAAAAGTVTIANATDSWGGSYGYHVKIDHGNGQETLYAHCSSICVTVGQQVQAGQVIAYVGHTGRATGSHLHIELRINGESKAFPFN